MQESYKAWYQIVFDNWAQITVLLGMILTLVQKLSDWNIKKKEIKFSRLQENKILEIKAFYKSYHAYKVAIEIFNIHTLFSSPDMEIIKEMQLKLSSTVYEFHYTCMTVKLFLDKEDIKTVDEIDRILLAAAININRWYALGEYKRPPEGHNNLEEIMQEVMPKVLPELIKRIETKLRRNFDLK